MLDPPTCGDAVLDLYLMSMEELVRPVIVNSSFVVTLIQRNSKSCRE